MSSAATEGQGGMVIIEEVMDQRRPVQFPATSLPVPAQVLLPTKVNPPAEAEEGVPALPEVNKPAAILLEERRHPVFR